MTQDLYLVFGIIIAGFAVPSMIGALAERRSPRAAAIAVLVGGSLILIAFSQKTGSYEWHEIPEAFVNVIAYFFR